MAKRNESEIIRDIQDVEGELSPENLSCDGEAPMSYVRKRGAELRRKRAALVKELGREPTNEEMYPMLYRR